jgi:NAD+ synthase (glutamine-hydrolysing)
MTLALRATLAQINPCVGDLSANAELILSAVEHNRADSDLIIFPELCLTAYPPEDLLLRADFMREVMQQLERVKQATRELDIALVVGHPLKSGDELYNAASVLLRGEVLAVYKKRLLPNYNVFDEKRYFSPGEQPVVFQIKGHQVGLVICEDIWQPAPVSESVAAGAQLIVVINASPFHHSKAIEREEDVVRQRAIENNVPILYVNQIGGQDELVFDGASHVVDSKGQTIARLPIFETAFLNIKLNFTENPPRCTPQAAHIAPHGSRDERIYKALVTGVRDYVEKNGFKGVVLGLSGGIDSALTMAIAVDALGKHRVEAVMMPYHYTSEMSEQDAAEQARTMGVAYEVISIAPMVEATLAQLAPVFAKLPEDTTEENIQARCRMLLLMAISNKKGSMVLTTGNKSEMAVGYATLYGDMAGGFAAIKDVPKTRVYSLSRYRNSLSAVIPERVITRPPSAELRPDQVDQDSLPDYDILDAILQRFVEEDQSDEEIIAAGFEREIVQRVIKMVVRNEYKRRQAAPGVRITPRAFGRDRRYPITSKFFK